jgi:hypothetical protein
MKSKFINVLIFAAGAAIGSAVTWKVVKTKYEQIAREEIESVKEAFESRLADIQGEPDENPSTGNIDEQTGCPGQINWEELEDLKEDEEEEEEEYVPTREDLNDYASLASNYTSEKGGAKEMHRAPYVIAPYDFGELDGYKQIELTYYEGDDTLEDDEYNIITDRDELLGPKALTTFGEYEDDAVFVRNERLRVDFQILKDPRTYKEARSIGPDQVDDE